MGWRRLPTRPVAVVGGVAVVAVTAGVVTAYAGPADRQHGKRPRHAPGRTGEPTHRAEPENKRRPRSAFPQFTALTTGAPEGTRTPNLLIRSQMLYPLSYGRPCNYSP